MGFNPETGFFEQSASTIIDSTPDGDTVKEGFNERNSPAITEVYQDLNTMFKMGVTGVPDGTTIIQNEGALKVNITNGIDENRQSTIMATSENDVVDFVTSYTDELEFYRRSRIGEVYSGAYTGSDPRIIIADGTNIDLVDFPEVLEKLEKGELAKTTNASTHSGAWSNVAGTVWKKPNFMNRYTKHASNVGFAGESGLPNIEGSVIGCAARNGSTGRAFSSASGAFTLSGTSSGLGGTSILSNSSSNINFYANRSNPIYGRSSTVDTDNIQQLPLIYMGKYTGA